MTDIKLKAAILIVSETASQDASTDKCIPILRDVFANLGNDQWEVASTEIVPDSVLDIQKCIRTWTDSAEPLNLIVTSGGTGFATKDVTPEVGTTACKTKHCAYKAGRDTVGRQTCPWSCVRENTYLTTNIS